jgi:DNA-binding winged helix-turn-helix (wHTH) protein/TolB-like protein
MDRRLYKFGPFVLDPASAILSHEEKRVPLTPKMSDTLLHLVQSGRRVVGKRELIGALWPNSFVEENNLTQNICRLRCVLARASRRKYIETVPKRGYRFTARVEEFWEHGDDLDEGKPATAPGVALPGKPVPEMRVVIGPVRFMSDAAPRSVVLLPFESLDGKGGDEGLRLGLYHCLTTRLSRIDHLTVHSPRGLLNHRDPSKDPLVRCQKLQAQFVLQGQYQRFDDRIRVTSQLVRVSDEVVVWASKFDEQFTDIFSVQDSLSAQVAQAVAREVKRSPHDKRRLPAYSAGRA